MVFIIQHEFGAYKLIQWSCAYRYSGHLFSIESFILKACSFFTTYISTVQYKVTIIPGVLTQLNLHTHKVTD